MLVLGMGVKRQAEAEKHSARTTKHVVSVSKMSIVREAMIVLPTE
jgi:hypothetical protein